jgi:hypothetical protein
MANSEVDMQVVVQKQDTRAKGAPKRPIQVRRKAVGALAVYDLSTGLPIGQILDMSYRGMKIMTEEPVIVGKKYYCRLPLDQEINGKTEVFFDAECRWCKQNEETAWFDSGYILRYSSAQNAEIIKELVKSWMVDHIARLNPHIRRKRPRRYRIFQRLLSIF